MVLLRFFSNLTDTVEYARLDVAKAMLLDAPPPSVVLDKRTLREVCRQVKAGYDAL